jgi:hypothetical protein
MKNVKAGIRKERKKHQTIARLLNLEERTLFIACPFFMFDSDDLSYEYG